MLFRDGGAPPPFILPLACLVGMFVCIAWIQVGLGSKFWQKHWEWIVEQHQASIGFAKGSNWLADFDGTKRKDYFGREGVNDRVAEYMFGTDMAAKEMAKAEAQQYSRGVSLIPFFVKMLLMSPLFVFGAAEGKYSQLVLQKPSVSDWMQRTAMFFFIGWCVLFGVFVHPVVNQCMETSVPACLLSSPKPELRKAECSPVGEDGTSPHTFSLFHGEAGNSVKRSNTDNGIKITISINR